MNDRVTWLNSFAQTCGIPSGRRDNDDLVTTVMESTLHSVKVSDNEGDEDDVGDDNDDDDMMTA